MGKRKSGRGALSIAETVVVISAIEQEILKNERYVAMAVTVSERENYIRRGELLQRALAKVQDDPLVQQQLTSPTHLVTSPPVMSVQPLGGRA